MTTIIQHNFFIPSSINLEILMIWHLRRIVPKMLHVLIPWLCLGLSGCYIANKNSPTPSSKII